MAWRPRSAVAEQRQREFDDATRRGLRHHRRLPEPRDGPGFKTMMERQGAGNPNPGADGRGPN